MPRSLVALALVGSLAACSTGGDGAASEEHHVKVDTESELGWRQFRRNVAFAEGYTSVCAAPEQGSTRPRVLVTGFGRFMTNRANATGEMVSELLAELTYPLTDPPAPGEVDDPAPQTRVAQGLVTLDGVGQVDVCAMVLPVFWDLSAVLVLAELAAFRPDVVVLNGIAGTRQPLWLELGARNEATASPDGSNVLAPEEGSPLLATAAEADFGLANLLSWEPVRLAAERALGELADTPEEGEPFGDVLQGVRFAGYPRASNTYLCNNTTYVVGYAMDHPGQVLTLLEPSHPRPGDPPGVRVELPAGFEATPRVFVHWPSRLDGAHRSAGVAVLRAMLDAQLLALRDGPAPARGDNAFADFVD